MKNYRVKPGEHIDLEQWDPDETSGFDGDKEEGQARTEKLIQKLEGLQEVLYAQHQHKLLVILQGTDTSGKDGTIKHVFQGVNPQGVRVASFKAPNSEELEHDFLWRIHRQAPGKGQIVLFNRSQYEDVLVVRVHNLVPEAEWEQRYEQINNFERMLADTGTTILKFFLHISKDEQKLRLQARLDDPTKTWKFNPEDLKERDLWPEYMKAYQAVLNRTSTDWAPWYIVPANSKWYRNLLVAQTMVDTLEGLNLKYPEPKFDPKQIIIV